MISFVESLSAKVHPTPPSMDNLSGLFQDFYAIAATHINTHISTLSSKQHRSSSPTASISSLSSAVSKFRTKAGPGTTKDEAKSLPGRRDHEQQMVTADEMAQRKRARRVLEQKRVALEEAIEKRVCEAVYDRIWRHRSTQDEAQDDKLRSKTAALCVVGIGLDDLGVDIGQRTDTGSTTPMARQNEVHAWLEEARKALIEMSSHRHPLGKLHNLKLAHKSIVDTLAHFHPSSSADEILPLLIYTLITTPTQSLDVISNLYFIQRFRSEDKIDGEAAYCLTNLEAAVTFLETVDLASLRADEAPSGPVKSSSRSSSPVSRPKSLTGPSLSTQSAPTLCSVNAPSTLKTSPSPAGIGTLKTTSAAGHSRRLSDLLHPPAQAIGAASDAILDTADQGFKTIGNSLGDSYKFLLGKLKERQEDPTNRRSSDVTIPKTLDDARRLVSTPPPEDDVSVSEAPLIRSPAAGRNRSASSASTKPEDKVLDMITGLRVGRESSTDRDSLRSVSSAAKKGSTGIQEMDENSMATATSTSTSPSAQAGTAASTSNTAMAMAESMRNFGNSLNPMSRIAGIGMIRGFGRSAASSPVVHSTIPDGKQDEKDLEDGGVADLSTVSSIIRILLQS